MASMKTGSCCLRTYSMIRHVHRISKLQDTYTSPVRCVKTASPQLLSDVDSIHAPVFTEKKRLLDHVLKSVVYDDEHILALNKATGVPLKAVHGEGVPSMVDILDDLRECYNTPELEYMLGLSRNQSGIILLSKHAQAKDKLIRSLQGTRSHGDLNQEFVCVCWGEPEFKTEVKKVRYLLKDINGRKQAVLVPYFHQHMKKAPLSSLNIKAEVLATSSLETSPKFSLVGITCDSGKKESLEMYMAEHLSPILGDHVYSHRVVVVAGVPVKNDQTTAIDGPQVLPSEVKHKLNVGKYAFLVPLHLHRSGLILRRFPHKKSEPLLIEAPLPDFFANTIEKLELVPSDLNLEEHDQEEYPE